MPLREQLKEIFDKFYIKKLEITQRLLESGNVRSIFINQVKDTIKDFRLTSIMFRKDKITGDEALKILSQEELPKIEELPFVFKLSFLRTVLGKCPNIITADKYNQILSDINSCYAYVYKVATLVEEKIGFLINKFENPALDITRDVLFARALSSIYDSLDCYCPGRCKNIFSYIEGNIKNRFITLTKLSKMKTKGVKIVPLEIQSEDSEEHAFIPIVDKGPGLITEIVNKEKQELVRKAIDDLTKTAERVIVKRKFGIGTQKRKDKEIAKSLDKSRTQIWRILKKALEKLRGRLKGRI